MRHQISRRTFLGGAVAGAAAIGLDAGRGGAATLGGPVPNRARRPGPGTLPNPHAPAGSDQIPEITTVVALMMENHTYDNILGMSGRGDGLTVANGAPTNSNPWPRHSTFPPPGKDAVLTAFPMPDPCQQGAHPYNTWFAGKTSFAGGKMDGFVKSQSGPVSMGYYDPSLMPFVNSLARTFPVCDHYFSSVMAQTYPNRRFLMAGTSLGQVADVLNTDKPPNGSVFELLNRYGISWKNYYSDVPSLLIWLYLANDSSVYNTRNVVNISEFFADAAAGTLPSFSMIDPNFGSSLSENSAEKGNSEEDPQDVQYGDEFMSQVVNALMASPQWPNILLVWTYDEGGGYYDHVAPPRAVKPDHVPPIAGSGQPAGTPFGRYGFRVPSGVVSPYAKPDYVSSLTYDHTSILKLVETKWNLPALTYRDAAALDLLDCVDLVAPPSFLVPPVLSPPADPALAAGCLSTGPGTIPPPGYVTTK